MGILKKYLSDAWAFTKRSSDHFWTLLNTILSDLTAKGNTAGRLAVFIAIYLVFSLIGAYNFAHLAAFVYIIWLLESKHGN